MKQNIIPARGFTLVELLVVITILAIISVTAYTSFSGATDKAKNSTKTGHLASIEGGLNVFFMENNYYPMPSQYNANTNVWGYSGSTTNATLCSTYSGTSDGSQILTVNTGAIVGGGAVFMSGVATQIGAKGTMDSYVLPKKYLSQELSDPVLNDIKVGNNQVLKDYGIGEYIYGVYAKNNTTWDNTSKKGSAYNLAMVLSDDQKIAVTKISGIFDNSTCVGCPVTLIGSGSANNNLRDGESYSGATFTADTRIAYPIVGF